MSDYDRGAYTPPTEESFAFDAREPRVRRPAPATLLGTVIVLVVLVGAVGFFYWSGVRGANEAPQVVGKPALQIKSAPPVSDAKPLDDSDKLEVYDEEKGQTAPASSKPAFAPPPEQPAPRGSLPAGPAPVQSAPLAPAKPAPAQAAPIRQAPATPAPAVDDRSSAVAAAAARRTAAEARDTFGESAPAPAAPAAKPIRTAKAEPAAPAADGAKGTMVQIGAFSTQAIADAEFAKAKAAFTSFTAGKSKHIERAEVGGKIYYRTAFAGFDRAGAHAFCRALLAAKKGCIVR
jgi:cytoskeletal protein RodZ